MNYDCRKLFVGRRRGLCPVWRSNNFNNRGSAPLWEEKANCGKGYFIETLENLMNGAERFQGGCIHHEEGTGL